MSVNVYFTDAVREIDGFTSKPYSDGSGENMRIDGLHISSDRGRLYAMLGDENSEVPDKLKDCVTGFSLYEFIPRVAQRETGIYRHGSAEAEVEDAWDDGKRSMYKVQITGKKMEDVRNLFRMIKTGAIRPEPEDSYEGEQLGMSRADLEAELERMTIERDDLLEQLQLSEATLRDHEVQARNVRETNLAFCQLVKELCNESWPFCTKRGVANRIGRILRILYI